MTDKQTNDGSGEGTHDGLPDGIPDPDSPPEFEDDDHVLAEDELVYPTFAFDDGTISQEEGFDLRQERDREELGSWLDALSGALVSHDLAVEAEDLRATFGVAPDDVRMQFEPDEDHRGKLTITLSLDAKVMRYENADDRPLGNRGGRGFIPLEMLEEGRSADEFRCYNWIDDPTVASNNDGNDNDSNDNDSNDNDGNNGNDGNDNDGNNGNDGNDNDSNDNDNDGNDGTDTS